VGETLFHSPSVVQGLRGGDFEFERKKKGGFKRHWIWGPGIRNLFGRDGKGAGRRLSTSTGLKE